MPGYVIHLSVAEEYLRKHNEVKEDYNEFIEGVIFPDSVKDKSETHYGPSSSQANLVDFLKENELNTSFKRGYFLHLFTDYLFYNKYIDTFSKDIYNDYDLLNKGLMEKYKVILPEKVKNQVFFKENEELKLLSRELVEKIINEVSEYDIDDIAKKVIEEPEKWTKVRPMKRI